MTLATLLPGLPFGYDVCELPHIRPPRLERERSKDGSCVNVSARERNKKAIDDASRLWVDHENRRIYCPKHVMGRLYAAIESAR